MAHVRFSTFRGFFGTHPAGWGSSSRQDWRVRLAAVVALGDLDARRFAEELGALHQDPDLQVRRSVGTSEPKKDPPEEKKRLRNIEFL